jgi:hypothetical protein
MAKKGKKKQIKVILLVAIGITLVLFLFSLISKNTSQELISDSNLSITPTTNPRLPNQYHSDLMAIAFNTPSGYSIEELGNFITLNNNKGEIIISRIGTNSDYLDGYLIDTARNNHLVLANKQSLTINALSAIKVDINGKRNYLFYKDNWVFTIETKSPELYADLDQIAKSFRYEP